MFKKMIQYKYQRPKFISISSYTLIFVLLILSSCRPDTAKQNVGQNSSVALKAGKTQTENKKLKPEKLPLKNASTSKLVHLIFFNIKDNLSETQLTFLISELKKLEQIEVVKNFHLGEQKDFADDRALKGKELMVKMQFENETDFYSYQKDQRHFKIKEVIGPFLDGLPLTYDYTIN